MSHAAAIDHGANGHGPAHGHVHEPAYLAARAKLDLSLVTPEPGLGGGISKLLWLVGVVCVIAVVAAAMTAGDGQTVRHALGAYHAGVLYSVGLALGALGLVMIFQQFNAGWAAAPRRQAENIASLFWVVLVLFLPIVILEVYVFKGKLFTWMNAEQVAGDIIYQKKAGFLNPTFWVIRAVVYFLIWIALGTRLYSLSREQDRTGDRWLTAKARFISSFGLLAFALTTAFAAFDWLMSLDYHWFSTMFGVYFFASNAIVATALIIVILTTLRMKGKLGPTFTQEHQHDLGKLLFAFTVFWAYVTLCQYFLIWYSNIPEETGFFYIRKQPPFNTFTYVICFGHFAVPFLLLLIRNNKRKALPLQLIALWMLLMHGVDLVFLIGPIVNPPVAGSLVKPWIDVVGILGPVCLFCGFVVQKMASGPLVPIKDPRLDEVLAHKNYV